MSPTPTNRCRGLRLVGVGDIDLEAVKALVFRSVQWRVSDLSVSEQSDLLVSDRRLAFLPFTHDFLLPIDRQESE